MESSVLIEAICHESVGYVFRVQTYENDLHIYRIYRLLLLELI